MKTEMRFTGAGCVELNDAILRALELPGGLTIENLRGPGFRLMERHSESADGLRTLAPLPDNSQKVIDSAVVQVGMDRLTVVSDILARGLTFNLTDALGVTQIEWLASNKVGNAQRTMSPEVRQENFLPDLLANRLPVYLTTSGFELDIRTLKMSRRAGMPLDVANVASATRAVNESIEDAAVNGATTLDGQDLQVAGYKAPGLINAPNAATQNLTATAWDATPDPLVIFAEVQQMMSKLRGNKKFGPYILYVNTEVGAVMDGDYVTAAPQNTIRERLLKLDGLSEIKTADTLPINKVVLVQMTSDVLDIVVGQRPTVIPWTSLSGMTFHNLILAIMIPRIKWDYNRKSGICIGTIGGTLFSADSLISHTDDSGLAATPETVEANKKLAEERKKHTEAAEKEKAEQEGSVTPQLGQHLVTDAPDVAGGTVMATVTPTGETAAQPQLPKNDPKAPATPPKPAAAGAGSAIPPASHKDDDKDKK